MTYWVYIVTNGRYGVLYVGVTGSLERRISQHKQKILSGFTAKHGLDRLVFFRGFGEVWQAIHFEKQLKRWRREWKFRLIERDNPHWADLYLAMMRVEPLHPALRGPGLSRAAKTGMTVVGRPRPPAELPTTRLGPTSLP